MSLMAVDVTIAGVWFALLVLQPGLHRFAARTELGMATLALLGVVVVLAWPLILGRFGVYQSQRREGLGQLVASLFGANSLGALLVATLAFVFDAPLTSSFPLLLAAGIFATQTAFRVPIHYALHVARRSGHNTRNVLVIGAGPRAAAASGHIAAHPEWGLRVQGFVDDGEVDFVPEVPIDKVHKMVELPGLLRDNAVDEVLVACPRSMLDKVAPVVRECSTIGVPVTLLTDLFGDELPPPRVGRLDSLGTICFAPVHHAEFELTLKRAIDLVGAGVGLVASLPVIAVAALAIRMSSRGPVFFPQARCGLNGRRFRMWKLRTMVPDAEKRKAELLHLNEMDGPVFKITEDPRVTPVGRLLRKWSIDELPQFWNVLRGDMSLVGPRPPTPDEVENYNGSDRRRLSMRPGLTCLWQVNGRNEVSFQDWMRLDLEYIDTWSLASDARILLRTLPQILLARGAS